MIPRTYKAVLIIFIAVAAGGCPAIWNAQKAQETPKPEELFKQAEQLFEQKKYIEAIDLYERLKSAHPDLEKTPQVYLKIADAHFQRKDYDKSSSKYNQFLELFPKHEGASRAKYMIAMGLFNQRKRTDLDASMTEKAAEAFKRVVDEAEEGEWKKKAEEKYRECRRMLADKELYKARAYMKMKKYKAARLAAQRILDEFPGLGLDKEAQQMVKDAKE